MIEESDLNGMDLIGEAVSIMESVQYAEMLSSFGDKSDNKRTAVEIIASGVIELIEQKRKITH